MQNTRTIIVCILLVLMISPMVEAVAIGVNRGRISYSEVLRGGFAREVLTVTTDSVEPISAEVNLTGELTPWLNLSAELFNFSKDNPYRLIVDVLPPLDAQIREYKANLSILTGELSRDAGGRIGTSTRASLGVKVTMSMTGTERAACTVAGFQVRDVEKGQPLEIQMSIINTGNVRLNPLVTIDIYDKYRDDMLDTKQGSFGKVVFPTLTERSSLFFSIDQGPDQYWATISVPECGYSNIQTFDILEIGAIKADGEFIRIDSQSWANVGEIIPVVGIFRNRGQGSLRAQFKGTIEDADTGSIAKVIDSDTYIVDPAVTAELETFFNPQAPGRYVVKGYV
ncbi:hypothetical protein GOV11_03040, partial [Candidatus Woesearchaeota archaeon]|nr:hypothetical protein [Candidatus Woesearchaeota archaeon]